MRHRAPWPISLAEHDPLARVGGGGDYCGQDGEPGCRIGRGAKRIPRRGDWLTDGRTEAESEVSF